MFRKWCVGTLAGLALIGVTLPAHAVIIDFNDTVSTSSIFDSVSFPYVEDGFEVVDGPIPTGGAFFYDQDALGFARESDYLAINTFTSVTVQSLSSAEFALHSLELGALLSLTDEAQWTVQGHLVGGGFITATGTAVNLSTVTFDSAWSNLTAVDILANAFSPGAIDNIHVTFSIPEPSSMLLFGAGLIGLVGIGRRRRRKDGLGTAQFRAA